MVFLFVWVYDKYNESSFFESGNQSTAKINGTHTVLLLKQRPFPSKFTFFSPQQKANLLQPTQNPKHIQKQAQNVNSQHQQQTTRPESMNKATALIILMLFFFFFLFTFIFKTCVSKSDISVGYQMSLTVPGEYSQGFIGKAFLMESDKNESLPPPKYRTALSVEASSDYRYACSLDLFLGTVKVWSSGHRSKFYAADMCVLELTQHGDLRLKDSNDLIGWRTGTNDQGVQRLRLLETGNMVLVDSGESIKWQTFNFPTDVLLVGQRLSVATHLTSYPAISSRTSWFYSLEIQHDKLGLYLNSGNSNTNRDNSNNNNINKYSYWEFQPSKGRNITFVELTSHALLLFDDALTPFAQIPTSTTPGDSGLRFMALDNSTGNLGLYYYNPVHDEFKPSFEALPAPCDLPLACSASNYTVCTPSGSCSCISHQRLQIKQANNNLNSDCGFLNALDCGQGEMVELEGVLTVLVSSMRTDGVSKGECSELCLMECGCKAALYGRQGRRECELYDVVSGVKETSGGEEVFMLKLGKRGSTKAGLRKWVLVVIVASDGVLLLAMAAGLAYFFLWKRRRATASSSSADL